MLKFLSFWQLLKFQQALHKIVELDWVAILGDSCNEDNEREHVEESQETNFKWRCFPSSPDPQPCDPRFNEFDQ